MENIIIGIFIIGYLAIALEHNLKLDKLIPALAMMAILWAIVSFGIDTFPTWFDSGAHQLIDGFSGFTSEEKQHLLEETLLHHLGKTAEILFFLLGAMTIVEIIDYFDGFSTFKNYIKTKRKKKLLWIFACLAFILSAIIDNLTATIVLITILQKIINDKNTRLWFAGLIIIAANAGGAWSPIGDVTTTMLWIANKVSAGALVKYLVLPSLICMVVPVFIASFLKPFQGEIKNSVTEDTATQSKYGSRMLYIGLGAIVFVPFFKTITHLPPYVGMMLSLSIVCVFAEIYSRYAFTIGQVFETENKDAKCIILFRNINGCSRIRISWYIIYWCRVLKNNHSKYRHCCNVIRSWISHCRQCSFSSCQYRNVPRTLRQPIMAFCCVFCRYRRKHVDYRFCRWCCCHGYGKNRFLLVL